MSAREGRGPSTGAVADEFRHEVLLYAGEDEFVERTAEFVGEGLEAGEPALVVVSAHKIDRLRKRLGDAAEHVQFADMGEVGHNPARIIPAWRRFVSAHAVSGVRMRGVGEPIYPERRPDELLECQRHELLLNVAFDGDPAWWLLCPYDTEVLAPTVIAEAVRGHPYVMDGRSHASANPRYRGFEACAAPFDPPLPAAPAHAVVVAFDGASVSSVRRVVSMRLRELGFDAAQTEDFALAVHELAANSVRHGGGRGTLRLWEQEGCALADVSDPGLIADPLAGRVEPTPAARRGRGLWLVNQLCDLVQIRCNADGSSVRAHLRKRSVSR